MGQLTPGATLIYERDGGIVYAREAGADPSTRREIGHTYDPRTQDGKPLAIAKPIANGMATIATTKPAVKSLMIFLVTLPLAKSS